MSMENLKKQETVESNSKESESTIFKAEAPSQEAAEKLAKDLEKAGAVIAETSNEIRKMAGGEMIKGKVESMPQTEAEKRLYENVGFDAESLEAAKAEFAGLSSVEAYNKFQILSLEKTQDFLMTIGRKTFSPSEKGGANLLLAKIGSVLKTAEMKKDQALRPYPALIQHANKKTDGYMALDGLSKFYAKNGYDDRGFLARNLGSSDTPFENFQKDLAESILTEQQQEDIMMMAKEAEKKAGNSAGAFAAGGITQKVMMESVFSRKTVNEIAPDKKIAA
ncbi:MAG: hypothetical protein WCJ57_01490 [Candidatus Falkowbacteria bacterium]